MEQFVTIARIVKVRGVRGEVAASLLTDFPERFSSLRQVRISTTQTAVWRQLERYWFHKGRVILKFKGLDRPQDVEALVGGEVQVPEAERFPLPGDTYYHSDLIGCQVVEAGQLRGRVIQILETGPLGANLVVVDAAGEEFMVPLVGEFILEVNLDAKRIEVSLPAGLIEP